MSKAPVLAILTGIWLAAAAGAQDVRDEAPIRLAPERALPECVYRVRSGPDDRAALEARARRVLAALNGDVCTLRLSMLDPQQDGGGAGPVLTAADIAALAAVAVPDKMPGMIPNKAPDKAVPPPAASDAYGGKHPASGGAHVSLLGRTKGHDAIPVYWRDTPEAWASTYIYLLLGRLVPDAVRFNAFRAVLAFGRPEKTYAPGNETIPLYVPVTAGPLPDALCGDGALRTFFAKDDSHAGYDGIRAAKLLRRLVDAPDTAAIVAVSRKPIGALADDAAAAQAGPSPQLVLVDLRHTGSQAYGALIAVVENAEDGSIFTDRPTRRIFPYAVINFVAAGGRLLQAVAGERAQAAAVDACAP